MKTIKILGLILISFFVIGCTDYLTAPRVERQQEIKRLKNEWRQSLQAQIASANERIEEVRQQCKGKFTVRYEMDGWVKELNIPVFWECTE